MQIAPYKWAAEDKMTVSLLLTNSKYVIINLNYTL